MRYQNLFSRIAFAAIFAGSISLSGLTHANYDFEALLAEIDFGAPGTAAEVEAPAASALTAAPTAQDGPAPIADPPAAEAIAPEPLPAEPAPVPMPVASTDGAVATGSAYCGQCSNQYGHHCGHGGHSLCKDGFCQPYMQPRLPTSTFYQYWRSNSCNTNVWDGFRNRCHTWPNCQGNGHCGNGHCGAGNCGAGNCADGCGGSCGPIPAEWNSCDACDR